MNLDTTKGGRAGHLPLPVVTICPCLACPVKAIQVDFGGIHLCFAIGCFSLGSWVRWIFSLFSLSFLPYKMTFVETYYVRSERAGVFNFFVVPLWSKNLIRELSRVNRSLSETIGQGVRVRCCHSRLGNSLVWESPDLCHSNPLSHPGFDKIKIWHRISHSCKIG